MSDRRQRRGGRRRGQPSESSDWETPASQSPPPRLSSSPVRRDPDDPRSRDVEDVEEVLDEEQELERRSSESEGEDLYGDDMMRDYIVRPGDDEYEEDMLDDAHYEELGPEARAQVEETLRKRDRDAMIRAGGMPAALAVREDMDRPERRRKTRRRRIEQVDATSEAGTERSDSRAGARGSVGGDDLYDMGMDIEDDEHLEDIELTLADAKGSLRDWIVHDANRRVIASKLRKFLLQYTDASGASVYEERIHTMCTENKSSLVVDFFHLSQAEEILALWLADAPMEMLRIFDEIAMRVVLRSFPNYHRISPEVHVRIANLPVPDNLRDIRQYHLNLLIRVSGVVTRRTSVFPQLRLVKFDCVKCGHVIGPIAQVGAKEVKPLMCPNCQSKAPFTINMEQTMYRNFQKITLQESPGSVLPGRLPRAKEVILTNDLIDSVRPGEEIDLVGILRNNYDPVLNARHGFPVFSTVIEANYVSKRQDVDIVGASQLTEEDRKHIQELSKDPRVAERIIQSMAPSIYGHDDIKEALALALFAGEAKNVAGKHPIRGDINVLLMGDPGTAKSQFLKYVEKTAHRSVFTTGKGSTAVGLTASVHKDPVTREWTLEGGALVLADQGVCLIDEFDKMNDQDRTSIHEAMEQQSISISKAGIVTSLQARCSVIAAANPRKGRYDPSLNFAENVELSDPILSRFDLLLVVRDVVDPIEDEHLASFVVNSHMRSHPEAETRKPAELPGVERKRIVREEDLIDQTTLRKYLRYAKQHCHPKLHNMNEDKLARLYADLRSQSNAAGGVVITVRHIESVIRMAESRAKMHLREYVRDEDFDGAIRMFLSSFVSTQKHSIRRNMERFFRKYTTFSRDHNMLLMVTLQELVRNEMVYRRAMEGEEADLSSIEVPMRELEARAHELEITNLEPFYSSELLRSQLFTLDRARKVIIKSF
uniref:DNA replication licensing factor MCM2 n=1 Tax=Stygiella incarcerata TaxID=1712417 RepID=A0A192ZHG2_9EUKA|nr:DNA replication licensing factor MCM2 [Stygiella incarcerata]|eukprot:TRINITY_DN82784_c0_g1_i1.p1 TRINITY_DN82784_c0_g1~~TRINITY_DN82784_c0_g1_i1.p1  ORF type:complete len:938 (+),score=248.32 TRINITY_DN82784_c0_g1_i1:86-2899(+)